MTLQEVRDACALSTRNLARACISLVMSRKHLSIYALQNRGADGVALNVQLGS